MIKGAPRCVGVFRNTAVPYRSERLSIILAIGGACDIVATVSEYRFLGARDMMLSSD